MRKLIVLILVLVTLLAAAPVVTPAEACGEPDKPCEPKSPGYWKNHPWPEGVSFSAIEHELFWAPVKGDKRVTMAKAVVAAKLNLTSFACSAKCGNEILKYIDMGHNVIAMDEPVAANSAVWQENESAYWALDAFNNGYGCK